MRGVAQTGSEGDGAVQILITGAGGFAGQHLIRYLRDVMPDASLHGTVYRDESNENQAELALYTLDVRDRNAMFALVETVKPDQVYHLAAQASVPASFDDPWGTFEVNVRGQINLLDAVRTYCPEARVMIASSAEVYGLITPEDVPIREDTPFRPGNPYAVSKVSQDVLAYQVYQTHGMNIMRARAFNHIGPGQSEAYVAAAFAAQIARIEAGLQEPVIRVGDLAAQRDFADVRDVIRAYHLILTQGVPGEAYNIASGQAVTIQYLLDRLIALTTVDHIDVQVDPVRLRPSRVPLLRGDYTALSQATGWQPSITFEQSLADILDDFRQRIQHQES